MNSMPIGSIILFSGKEIPEGWVECNGSSVTGTPYAAINNEKYSPKLDAPEGSVYIVKVREVSSTVILDRAFANNDNLRRINDAVVYSEGAVNKDVSAVGLYARDTQISAGDIGYTEMNDILGVDVTDGKSIDITDSLKNRSTLTDGDPVLFAGEPINGRSAVDVLPFATKSTRGVVVIGSNIDIRNGVINVGPASTTKLGLVKAGNNITITADGTINGVNSYVHPSTHPATIITTDATHRFVTDTQISTWNAKANTSGTYTGLVVGSASKWTTARTLTLAGNVTGSVSIDGSANVSITTKVANNSHTHLWANITDKPSSFTPSAHNQASNTITAMTGYAKASAVAAISASDSLNVAIGKLEKALDGKQAAGSYAPSSHTHNYITSRGNVTAETGTSNPATAGMSMSQAYNNGYPATYGNVITLNGSGKGQIFIGWSGTSGAHADNYIRSKRDVGDANWSGWARIWTSANFNPATKLNTSGGTINGTLTVTGQILSNADVVAYSDKRFKVNITKMVNCLDKIDFIHGYKYSMLGMENEHQVGLIAQELKDILPEAIYTDANGYLGIRYNNMIPFLVECIKELKEKINRVV